MANFLKKGSEQKQETPKAAAAPTPAAAASIALVPTVAAAATAPAAAAPQSAPSAAPYSAVTILSELGATAPTLEVWTAVAANTPRLPELTKLIAADFAAELERRVTAATGGGGGTKRTSTGNNSRAYINELRLKCRINGGHTHIDSASTAALDCCVHGAVLCRLYALSWTCIIKSRPTLFFHSRCSPRVPRVPRAILASNAAESAAAPAGKKQRTDGDVTAPTGAGGGKLVATVGPVSLVGDWVLFFFPLPFFPRSPGHCRGARARVCMFLPPLPP